MEKILGRQPRFLFIILGGSKKPKLSKISNFYQKYELLTLENPFFPQGTHLKIAIIETALKKRFF